MDFKLVIVVLFTYFIRPQDWVPGMSGFNIMQPLMAVTLLAMLARPRGISPASFIKTPVDWAIIAYGAYIAFWSPGDQRPFGTVLVLTAYYFVTSQALSTPRRLTIYLRCWMIALVVVAAMAVAGEYGLDLTGAKDLTNAVPENPRLVLNTYLFDNANSLGHSVVILIPLAYFLLFWGRPAASKLLTVLPALLAGYCVYLTKSKGAYIVGFSVLIISQLFSRSILFQVIMVLLALTIGLEGLNKLPRMTDFNRARQDEAIMGRMLAWEQARIASKESPYGQGFRSFKPMITFDGKEIYKATHSSYVLVGAELGQYGMFFYLAVIYASLRVLVTTRCRRKEDEISRRAMLVLLLGYMASSWLIDRSYHLEYFLLAGAVSGFHRRLGVEAGLLDPFGEVPESDYEEDAEKAGDRSREPARAQAPPEQDFAGPTLAYHREDDTIRSLEDVDTSTVARAAIEEELARRLYWRRFSIIDALLVVLFTKIVIDVWDYLLQIYFI